MKLTGIIATAALFVSMLNGASAAAHNIRGASTLTDVAENAKAFEHEERQLLSRLPYYYEPYHEQGCRDYKGYKGDKGHDYEFFTDLNKRDCEKLCDDYGDKCKAYEYGKNHCEIWFTYVPRTGHASGLTCYVKKDDEDEYYYKNNHNKACRTAHGGKGVEGKDYYKYDNVEDCSELCDAYGWDCQAYESGPEGHCEIWKNLPVRFADNHGFNCALKSYY